MPRKKLDKPTDSIPAELQTEPAAPAVKPSSSTKKTPAKKEAPQDVKAAPKASGRAKKAAPQKAAVPEPAPAAQSPAPESRGPGKPKTSPRRTPKAAVKAEPSPAVAEPEVVEAETAKPQPPTAPPAPSASGKVPLFGRKPKPAAAAPEPEPSPEPPVVQPSTPPVEPVAAEPAPKRSRRERDQDRRRGRREAAQVVAEHVVVEEPTPNQEPAPAPEAKGRNRKGRGGKPAPKPAPERSEDFDFASLDLPEPIWRPRQAIPAAAERGDEAEAIQEAAGEATEEDTREDANGRKRRRRRRGGRPGTDEPAEEAAVERTEEEPVAERPRTVVTPRTPQPAPEATFRRDRPAVKPPEKAAIPIPEEAPQVVVRNGVPTLVRNHRVYPPLMFFGSPSDERRAETVLEEVKMAAEAGVHLHSYLIDFEVDPNTVDEAAKVAAYVLARSVQVDPESQVIFRIVFQAPRGWEEKYSQGKYRNSDGSTAEPSVCDDEFWSVARTCLERFTKQIRLLDLRDHILGLHLERGEWFFAEGAGYDDSKAAQAKFRDWARLRYLDDVVTLRASWFDGSVRFDNLQIPPYRPDGEDGDRFIRSSRRQRRHVDYHLFLSDATVQRIADLAYAAKAASEGHFLIGASYGYTFEWSHPASGHLSLGKLLRTPEIDFIAGPPSYRSRQPGGTAAFPGPIDSFALNGKLYISEEDFKTSLSIGHEPDDFNPQLKTPQALESVHWRGVGAALAHASGVAWMDLWGNGWLRTHSVWERARKVREALTDRLAAPLDDPEVAIFIDERALAYLVDDHAFKLLVQNVRESVLRAGVSAAFYLLSDLAHREKFPESKLYIFVNAWDVRPELRAAIKSRLQRDNKVLFWLYSAGLFDAGRESLERAREVTGIALKPQPFYSKSGTTILNRRHPLAEAFPDRNVVGGTKLEPSYFAIPEGATVLGEYTQTGLPSFVVKDFAEGPAETHWTSVFLGEPVVNPALIRALAQMAGAHVWNHQEDVVHVRHPFCTVHCQSAGQRTIMLPGKYSAYNLLSDEWNAVDSPNLRFTAVEGSTYCFLVGPRDELENRLNADPRSVLHIENLPPRDSNVRQDSSSFDVPIMKLDEWMEAGDSDDNADEWFLRPQQIEEERPAQAEEEDRVGRRRRKRRGNGKSDGSPQDRGRTETISAGNDLEEFGLSVMFRKRE